jgi:hypothetical protein
MLENVALRHQLAVLRRTVKRPHIKDTDRIFWIMCAGCSGTGSRPSCS